METTETVVPEHYNPNQIVTYKVIDNGETSYLTEKVTTIEYALDQGRYWRKQWNELGGKVARLENDLEQYLDMESEEIIAAICEIFGFEATKEIEFEASATITGRVRVPLSELSEFDVDSMDLTVYADSHSHDVDVDIEIDQISRVD